MNRMHIIYIGIGSNLGDREVNCLTAIELMKERGIPVLKQSATIETPPWGVEDQPYFMNMAVEARTSLDPFELLQTLKEIEDAMGREKTVRWGPRLIDLDILFYDDLIMKEPDLQIPHPLIQKRAFVLTPLKELAPDLRHPETGQSIREIFEQFHQNS